LTANDRGSYAAIFLLFLLSGATSLVYEVIWLRQLILIFGSTQFAASTILSTFMAGLALGAFIAGRWLGRTRMRPLRVYGLLEIGIGIYALIVPFLFDQLSPIYRALWQAGASESFFTLSLAKFAGIAIVLLPPTVLMGASLPVLARQVADDPDRIGGKVGFLYAVNTFGAVAGVFVSGFVAIPGIGVQKTIWLTALVNGLLGMAAILLARRFEPVAVPLTASQEAAAARRPTPAKIRLALLVFAMSGFGALVLEVAWTRVLALVMGSSVYAFSLMLLAFLIGLALGSTYFSKYLRRRPNADPAVLLCLLLAAAGALAYATAFLFQWLPRLFAEIYFNLSPGPNGWFVVQLFFGLMIMFPATFALGGIFPAVVQIHARSLEKVASSVGTVYASNTVGTIVGAALAGFVLIPQLGVMPTVITIAALEILLGLAVALVIVAGSLRQRIALALPMALAVLVGLALRPGWDINVMNSGVYMNLHGVTSEQGWEHFKEMLDEENNVILYAEEGLTASVFVADQPAFDNRYLSVNGKIEASTRADLETQLMCAHLPLLLHEKPDDVMVIGLASGITVGAVSTHPVEKIRVVEIERAMEDAARLFADANYNVLDDPRLELSFNDARNELEFSPRMYDVIISEPSNPWMTVASNLFTEDFFRMARTRVRPDGVFSQWIQNYYLPAEDLRSIISAFRASFPEVLLFETFDGVDLLLMGSQQPLKLDLEKLDQRMRELKVRIDMARINIKYPLDIIGLLRLNPAEVATLVDGAPRNTDDNARVEFSAPKALGLNTLPENLAMIRRHMTDPLDVIEPPVSDPAMLDRMRLTLARRWLLRGNYDLAASSAQKVSQGPLRARAEEILYEAKSKDSKFK
jgi:spermidine synthase